VISQSNDFSSLIYEGSHLAPFSNQDVFIFLLLIFTFGGFMKIKIKAVGFLTAFLLLSLSSNAFSQEIKPIRIEATVVRNIGIMPTVEYAFPIWGMSGGALGGAFISTDSGHYPVGTVQFLLYPFSKNGTGPYACAGYGFYDATVLYNLAYLDAGYRIIALKMLSLRGDAGLCYGGTSSSGGVLSYQLSLGIGIAF
jgi:hypothetical protein